MVPGLWLIQVEGQAEVVWYLWVGLAIQIRYTTLALVPEKLVWAFHWLVLCYRWATMLSQPLPSTLASECWSTEDGCPRIWAMPAPGRRGRWNENRYVVIFNRDLCQVAGKQAISGVLRVTEQTSSLTPKNRCRAATGFFTKYRPKHIISTKYDQISTKKHVFTKWHTSRQKCACS